MVPADEEELSDGLDSNTRPKDIRETGQVWRRHLRTDLKVFCRVSTNRAGQKGSKWEL